MTGFSLGSSSRSVFGGSSGGSVFGEAAEGGSVDLNLTPLMDVMSNILFFLLASVGASVVALLPASVPTRSDSAGSAEPARDQVMVTLQLAPVGFTANLQNESLPAAELQALRFSLPAGAGPWALPYEALTAKLWEIKKKYPASDTIILLPEPKVPYDVIIRTMDAARGLLPPGSPGREGQKNVNLFTKVVISDLNK